MDVETAQVEYNQRLRNFGSPVRNNATAGSLNTRNDDEQNLARAGRFLMGAGAMQTLKRKYRGRGSVPGRKMGE